MGSGDSAPAVAQAVRKSSYPDTQPSRRHRLATKAQFVTLAADEYEAALLGDTPRAGVVDVTGEVDALQFKLARAPRD